MAIEFKNVYSIIGPNGKDVTRITRKSDGKVLWDKRRWVIKDGKLVETWKDPTGQGIGRFLRVSGVRWATSSATQDDFANVAQATVTQKSGYVEVKYSNVTTSNLATGQLIALIGNGSDEGSNSNNRRFDPRAIMGTLPKVGVNNYYSTMTISVLAGSTVTGKVSLAPTDGFSWTVFGELKTYNYYKTDPVTYSLSADKILSGANPALANCNFWWHANCTTQLSNINKSVGTGLVKSDLQFTWSDITMKVKDLYYYE